MAAAVPYLFSLALASGIASGRPNITRHGTWDLGMVETTPINVKGQIWLFVDSAEQPCGPQGCFPPCSAGIEPCVPGRPVTKPCCSSGENNLRFIDVLSGDTVGSPFGTGRTGGPGGGEGLGCALYVEDTDTVYVYVTTCGKVVCEVNVYSSLSTDMKTWAKHTAISTEQARNIIKSTLWNTSVERGKVNGTEMYVMAFETDLSYWTTRFAVSEQPIGPWRVLDVGRYWIVSPTLETADPTLRYNAADGYWYCMTGRKSPSAWFFFMEIYRAREVTGPWEPAPGQGNASTVGTPMLAPLTSADVAADRSLLSPAAWHGGARAQFLIGASPLPCHHDTLSGPGPCLSDGLGRLSREGGREGGRGWVSHSCACNGSLCLRHCVHGASIGAGGRAGVDESGCSDTVRQTD
jgi:hypothetical protein